MCILNAHPRHAPSLCSVGAMYKARGMLQVWPAVIIWVNCACMLCTCAQWARVGVTMYLGPLQASSCQKLRCATHAMVRFCRVLPAAQMACHHEVQVCWLVCMHAGVRGRGGLCEPQSPVTYLCASRMLHAQYLLQSLCTHCGFTCSCAGGIGRVQCSSRISGGGSMPAKGHA